MKTNIKFLLVALVAFSAFSITSCSEDDPAPTPAVDNTITGKAVATPNLSSLVAALNRAGLASTLQGTGPFTVFAPTNDAFDDFLDANGLTSINDIPVDVLRKVLQNHVLSGKKEAANLSTGYESTLANYDTSTTVFINMYVSKTGNAVRLNGESNVTTADVQASNGVIHIVDKVIALPTIVTHAVANPNFSVLVQALTRSDMPNFAGVNGILKSTTAPSPFTVFAPVDAAFTTPVTGFLAENGFADLASIPTAVLEKTLKYHVITGVNGRASTLVADQSYPTYAGNLPTPQNVIFKTTPTRLLDVNGRPCNIIVTDVQCVNGVIHVLDRVLLPTF
jgi:uncharacterized surface protein with fasciclin (FAS1) repeats